MKAGRWLVALGALFIAGLALYVLIVAKPPTSADSASSRTGPTNRSTKEQAKPAMDEIDSKSREAMRELLRETE